MHKYLVTLEGTWYRPHTYSMDTVRFYGGRLARLLSGAGVGFSYTRESSPTRWATYQGTFLVEGLEVRATSQEAAVRAATKLLRKQMRRVMCTPPRIKVL